MSALALAATLALFAASADAEGPPAQEPGVVVEVAKAAVARVAPRRWVPGGVVSRNDARLATSAAGRLEYVAEVGTRVRAGERVAKLEDEAVRLRVDDAKAEVARIESQRAMSERQLQRLEKVGDTISQTQLDEVRSQLAVLTAQLQQAQVRQRVAQHDLDQTELRAPFAGVVTERLAQRGEYVATGAAIAHLVDTVHLEARVQAPLTLVGLGPAGHGVAGQDRRTSQMQGERAHGRARGRRALTSVRAATHAREQRAERRHRRSKSACRSAKRPIRSWYRAMRSPSARTAIT